MIRERVAEKLREMDIRDCLKGCNEKTPCKFCIEADSDAEDILEITNPPLTVWLPCDKCGGDRYIRKECPHFCKTINSADCFNALCGHWDRSFCEIEQNGRTMTQAEYDAIDYHAGRDYKRFIKEPCTCTDGRNEREIEWSHDADCDECQSNRVEPCCLDEGLVRKTLHLHDLIDPDVVYAYTALLAKINIFNKPVDFTIPNNKGTLRIREAK